MPTVFIPALLRHAVGGQPLVAVPGITIGEVVSALIERYPELRVSLFDDDRLRPSVTVAVDGTVEKAGLCTKVHPDAEVYFIFSIRGG